MLQILHVGVVIKSRRWFLVSLLVVVQELEASAAGCSIWGIDLRCSEWRAGIAHIVSEVRRVIDLEVLLIDGDIVLSSYQLVHFLASRQSLCPKPELVVWK